MFRKFVPLHTQSRVLIAKDSIICNSNLKFSNIFFPVIKMFQIRITTLRRFMLMIMTVYKPILASKSITRAKKKTQTNKHKENFSQVHSSK